MPAKGRAPFFATDSRKSALSLTLAMGPWNTGNSILNFFAKEFPGLKGYEPFKKSLSSFILLLKNLSIPDTVKFSKANFPARYDSSPIKHPGVP